MWTRKELKSKAKLDIKKGYWKAVGAAVLLAFCTGGSSGGSSSGSSDEIKDAFSQFSSEEILAIIAIVIGAVALALIIGLVLKVFVLNPLSVGGYKFFVDGTGEEGGDLSVLGFGFKNNYKNQVAVLFMTKLFISLWSLLLVIPGIVKAYQYKMVPYILGENPDINYKDALALSKEMMEGHKWNTFVLDLSFILWYILSGITLGVVYIFYVGPYVQFTSAELYKALKGNGSVSYETV